MMEVYDRHDFGPDFEQVVVSCIMGGNGFYRRFCPIIKADAFHDDDLRFIVEIVETYHDEYKRVPSPEILVDLIRNSTHRNRGALAERIETLPPTDDLQYVEDRMMGWAKWTSVNEAVETLTHSDDPVEYARRIEAASRIGDNLRMEHTCLSDNDLGLSEHRPIVPTPWGWLNDRLFGGPELQDLAIILAFVNVGKTAMLVNIAKHAVRQGMHVVYFTFEDGERKIKRRFVQSITGFTREKLLAKPKKANRKKNEWLERCGGRLDIKGLQSRRSTVMDAMAFVKTVQDSEGDVKLVITDYADRFRPPRKRTEDRTEYREVFEECKFMATDLNCLHWTASQVQRGRAGMERVGIEHVAESIGKIEPADIVIGVGQTRDDEELGVITLYTAKMRDARKGDMVRLNAEFETQRIKE